MKESYTILPVPSGDVSGIASALYELEGMVVIHDPSGCNSTYNTHDELRWYDKESYIFISGLNMRDAVLGNDKKFISDIVEAATYLTPSPKFIALCNSPVPYLNGTDFEGICKIVEHETKIPCFYVQSNGMHDYICGVQEAYISFAKKMLKPSLKNKSTSEDRIKINIFGATPLDFGNPSSIDSLRKILMDDGLFINSVWSLDTNFDEIMRTIDADVNLVISSTGIPLAEYFYKEYKIPYVIGAPVSKITNEIMLRAIKESANKNRAGVLEEKDLSKLITPFKEIKAYSKEMIKIIIGESVISYSLAAEERNECDAVVLCPYPYRSPVMRDEDSYFDGEEELLEKLRKIKEEMPEAEIKIMADPMYRHIISEEIEYEDLPTLAISGRRYKSSFIDFFEGTLG